MNIVKKLTSMVLATTILFSTTGISFADSLEKTSITIEDAVRHGIKNSKQLDEVEVEIDLAKVSKNRGRFKADKLRDSDRDLDKGNKALSAAQDALDNGIIPQDVEIPGMGTINAGTPITSLPENIQGAVKGEIQKGIDKSKEKLTSGQSAIANALELAGSTIGSAIDFASLTALDVDSSSNLMELMPSVAYEVTKASYDIYKNGIALLIQKSYYDVLQAEELVRVKEKAMKRGEKQYEFAKAAYEEGMKAKDDMLMAKVYYDGTQVEYEKAKGELNGAKIELKKIAGYDMGKDLTLETVMKTGDEDYNLEEGLKLGMEKRLEIKKTVGEVLIYTTNFTETKKSYPENTFQYKEAKLLQDKSGIKYEQAKDEVESSIRKSYEMVLSTKDMLKKTNDMVKNAKENVEISEYKYKEGFGVDTSMLASMNLESSAGTIVEVLAAEEKLAEVEENVVKITYAYNLSRMQYKNNIGDFIY